MYELFTDYKAWVEDNPILVEDYVGKDADRVLRRKNRPFTFEGFCNYLEDSSIIANPIHYFINYEGRYEDYVSICSRIKREIRTNQIEGGMVGIFNPSITQRLNGLTEKSEVEASVKVTSLPVEVKPSPDLPTDEK
jgi:hypothetical protein